MLKRSKDESNSSTKDKQKLELFHFGGEKDVSMKRGRSASPNKSSSLFSEFKITSFQEILELFPNLPKFNHSSIKSYNTADLPSKYETALKHFTNIILLRREELSVGLLKEDLMKVIVICIQYCVSHLKKTIPETKRAKSNKESNKYVRHLITLQSVLEMWLGYRNTKTLEGFLVLICKIISESIEFVHDSLKKGKKTWPAVAKLLNCQYQILGILIQLGSHQENTATELIKTVSYTHLTLPTICSV
eukprot:TRINITY_DN1796_c0_g1_i1.p1 TRINITY_DN1796_c0_g1~~TRINITY_DN1796_c0_g1_i1.p1  ORF type:complete len:247 (+),score=13.54 TRINITY_DN1796_c0_g1_i1:119-859(+)